MKNPGATRRRLVLLGGRAMGPGMGDGGGSHQGGCDETLSKMLKHLSEKG